MARPTEGQERWIRAFVKRHEARHDCGDWPTDAADRREFLRGFLTAFTHERVSEAEAEAASRRLQIEPGRPRFKGEHLPALLESIRRARLGAGESPYGEDDTCASAKAASQDCSHCGGNGLALVYRQPARYPDCTRCGAVLRDDGVCAACHPRARKVPLSVPCRCVCRAGRWFRRAHDRNGPAVARLMFDLTDVLEGRSVWQLEPPEPPTAPAHRSPDQTHRKELGEN